MNFEGDSLCIYENDFSNRVVLTYHDYSSRDISV